ncbi:MAG: hypothetical protein IKH57_15605 [Clostridia bacterium]|nr:hypothetical protein [Clostridia bacterium]
MKIDGTLFKRVVAFLLTLALVFTSGDFIPAIATAMAEGESAAIAQEKPDEKLDDEQSDIPGETKTAPETDEPAPTTVPVEEENPAPAPVQDEPASAPADEEPAPAPVEENPAPAPAEEEPAPTIVEEEPVPAPVEEEPAPAPVEEEPVPAPAEEEPAPAPAEEEPAPVLVEEEPAPAPVEEEPASAPVEEEAAPAPVEEEPAPVPVEEDPVPAPVEEEAAPAPVEEEPASAPAEEEPVPAPVEEEPAPTTVEEEPVPAPAEEEPVPAPVEEEPVPAPVEEEPAPAPTEEEPVPAPTEEEPVPAPTEEEPAPTIVEEEPVPAPAEEEPAPAPVEEEPAPASVEEESAPVPVEEDPASVPVEEESAPAQVEEEPAPTIVEEEPAPAPVEEEPSPAPEVDKNINEEIPTVSNEEDIPAAGNEEEEAPVIGNEEEQAPAIGNEEEIPAVNSPSVTTAFGTAFASAPEGAMAPARPVYNEVTNETNEKNEAETETEVSASVLPEETQDAAPASVSAAANESRTLNTQVGDYVITASGNIPEGAEIQVVEIPEEAAKQMTGEKPLFAYDIRLVVDGKVWQPEDYGTDVQISVKNVNEDLNTEAVEIIHVKTDLMETDGSLSDEAVEKAVQGLSEGNVSAERIDTDTNGSAVSFETSSFSGFLGNAMTKLETMFSEAMKNRASDATKVQLNLDKDTTYEGDSTFSNVGYDNLPEDFEVELVAADAGEDHLQSEGTTSVAGNITIKGINVKMMGVTMGAGKTVSVEDAKLEYYGTKKDDAIAVNVKGDKSEANIYTGEGNDSVQVTAEAGSVAVDASAGSDKVEVNVSGKATAKIATGEGDDTVKLTDASTGDVTVDTGDGDDSVTAAAEKGNLSVKTGAGDDKVEAALSGSANAVIDTGDGDDKVKITDDAKMGGVNVKTGAGDDSVEVDAHTAGNGGITVDVGAGDDTVTLANQEKAEGVITPLGKINVYLGEGFNEASLDMAVSNAATELSVDGSEGSDHLHITGTLNKDTAEDDRAKYNEAGDMVLVGPDAKALTVKLAGIESVTDELVNKRTVKLTPAASGNVVYTADKAFTNYIINAPADKLNSVTVSAKDSKALALSSVLINTATTWNGVNKLLIKEGAVIDVRGLTLTLDAENIEINGTLKADLVQIKSEAGTGKYGRDFNDLYNQYKEQIDIPVLGEIGAGAAAAAVKAADFFNVSDEAKIVIGEKAAVYSKGDVIILAQVDQSNGLLSLPVTLNLIDVKIAQASVDIAGKIYAGYDFEHNQSPAEGSQNNLHPGSVKVDAQVKTSVGSGDKSIPTALAVSVADVESSVTVRKGAVIEVTKDISIASKTELNAKTKADSGTFGVPAAVAVAVLVSDSHNTVDGTVTSVNGNIKIAADGQVDASTTADKGEKQEGVSGGYVAVSVVLQDVKAELGANAVVTAQKDVKVQSNAVEKVEDHATTAESKDETAEILNSVMGSLADSILGPLKDTVWPLIKDSIKSDSAKGKLDKAMKKLSSSNKSVKLDDYAEEKGQVKTEITTGQDGKTKLVVNVKPWEGYEIKSITVRSYAAGQATFQSVTREIGDDEETTETFDGLGQNIIVFVDYEEKQNREDEDAWQPADLFEEKPKNEDDDLQKLLDDVQSGTDGDSELDRILADAEDESKKVKLTLAGGEGGAVLTYDFLPDTPNENLKEVQLGSELRLLPNPADGMKLKQGSLKVTYTVKEKAEKDGKEEEKEVTKIVVVNADSKGRYIFNVPEALDVEKGIKVTAEFEKGEQGKNADESQTQVVGTVAVTVAGNDSQAVIDAGAKVVSGGKTDVVSNIKTDVNTVADGSAVSKKSESSEETKKKEDKDAIKRPEAQDYSGYDAGGHYLFGLKLDETINGEVSAAKADADKDYAYTFTATPTTEGYSVSSALLTYTEGGKTKTVELKKDGNGKYNVELVKGVDGNYTIVSQNLAVNGEGQTFSIDKGCVMTVSFAFAKEGEYGVAHSVKEAQAVLPHAIQLSYNSLKDDKEKTGEVTYKETKTEDGKTYYVFEAKPEAAKGYTLDGSLKASWTTDALATGEAKLEKKDDGFWYLDASKLPKGAQIKVSASFKEEFHEFTTDDGSIQNGSVKLHDKQVKQADKPKITVTPNAGYSVSDVTVTYTEVDKDGKDKTVTLKLSDENSKISKAKDDKGNEIEGVYTFTVPGMKQDSNVKVSASFKLKSIGIRAGEGDEDKDKYILSEKNVAVGDKVTVTLLENDVKAGKKPGEIEVKVTDNSGNTKEDIKVTVNEDGSFVVPDGMDATDKLVITKVTPVEKDVAMEAAVLENGSITPAISRADKNETVTVTVKLADNFKVKKGTLKAVIQSNDGTYTEEVFMSRQNDTTYTFIMPDTIENPKNVKVTFAGEFEPGQSDSSAVDTSLGAGIAVTVANSEGRADVKGSVTAGGVNVKSFAAGEIKTEAKAGFSKGNIGIGGAVAVQVASTDSKALVHSSAVLTTDGSLKVNADSDLKFTVNADASGSKEAKKVGVGAGIAVAVDGADTYAAIADGSKLSAKSADKNIKDIAVSASQKVKDTVSAKAGASGGTADVPVAAVNVIGVGAEAYMGKVNGGTALKLSGSMSVSARTDAAHTMAADASATGKGAGVGAAISVSVISDEANARLNQSVDGKDVAVSTETVSDVSATATASASGGKKEGKSADKQSDGLLGTAGKLAAKNNSKSVSTDQIDKASSGKRQQAQTSEGTVGVAGAVAVNVQNSVSRSEIMKGVNVKASGTLTVTAQNGTVSKVKANASTTNSDVGVGVGAAVNIIWLTNIASLSDGDIEAAILKVAATTKIKEPEKKTTETKEKKAEDKKGLVKEIGEKVKDFMADLIKEMGLDEYVSADKLGEIVGDVAQEVAETLIKEFGLSDFVGDKTFEQIFNESKKALEDTKDALLALPEKLAEPFMEALDEVIDLAKELSRMGQAEMNALKTALENAVPGAVIDLNNMTGSVKDAVLTLVENEFLKELQNQITSAPGRVLSSVVDGMMDYLKDQMVEILTGGFSVNVDEKLSEVMAQAGKEVAEAVRDEVSGIVSKAFGKALQAVEKIQLPGMTMQSADNIVSAFNHLKDAASLEKLEKIYDDTVSKVTKTFDENVLPYKKMFEENFDKLSKIDFKKKISDGLRSAAKKALVTIGNEAIDALSDHFDLKLKAEEEKAAGYVIDTQAIAGAGARDVGVAGSVAVTVLNAETSATVADGGKLTVTGGMTVDANELRSVKNIASAAADKKGNAAANKNAGKEETKKAGGGNDAESVAKNEKETVKLTVGVGGTAEILQGDKTENRPKLYFTLKEGYKMPEGDKVNYSYTDKSGFEVTGTVTAQKDGNRWYVDTKSGELAEAGDAAVISLELKPKENLHNVPAPSVDLSAVTVDKGAVSVKVQGRDVEQDDSGKETLSAKAGDLVEIRIDKSKTENGKVVGIGYSWKDAEGKTHDVELMVDKDAKAKEGKKSEFTLVSSNEKEITYTFTMPDGEISDIIVAFDKDDEKKDDSKTTAKDNTGKGVGVGAAFSLVYGDSETTAKIGKRTGFTAGELSVTAASDHKENIASAAGTDPLTGKADLDNVKKYSVDASVALNILDNDIKASVADSSLTTNGYGEGEEKKDGNLTVTAKENSKTETAASAFAVGGKTAVGASVAVNVSLTAVNAEMLGSATVAGSAEISADSHSEDDTHAIATAMGADIARGLKKLGETTDKIEEKANKLLDGSIVDDIGKGDKKEKKEENKTAGLINERLDQKKAEGASGSSDSNSLSSNVLRTQDVKAQGENAGNEGTQEVEAQIKDKTGLDVSANRKEGEKKWQVAAAVGVTVSDHAAETTVGKIVAGKAISVTSTNTGNFNTMGTGAAMSFAEHSNSIAAGVAVSVNENKANTRVTGALVSTEKENITVTSKLTQNLDGNYAGKLAAQALSGSVSGKNSSVSIAGAVSVLVSGAESTVDVAGNSTLSGGDVAVEATDKSKLAVRAGGVNLSGGSSFGMGLSSATVVSSNDVSAAVGDNVTVEGKSFKLNAEKQAVTADDYKNLIDLKYLVTDSSALDDKQRKEANTGLIDVHKGKDEDSYQVEVNLSSDKLLEAVDGLNFLSSQNTYVEAIAGSVMYGEGKTNLAGSFAVTVTDNTVNAILGRNAKINLTGDMSVTARNGSEDKAATTRIIAGSLSAGPAKTAVGATVAVLVSSDEVKAETGSDGTINAEGSFTQDAVTNGEIQVFTAAMAVAAGVKAGNAGGGAVNVIVTKNQTENSIGNNTDIQAKGNASVKSDTRLDLIAISGSANVSVGAGSSVAAGGVVNVIVDKATAETKLGDQAKLTGFKDGTVASNVSDRMLVGTASLSVAATGGSGKAIAGVANVIVDNAKAHTTLGDKARAEGTGNVNITANNDAYLLNAGLSLAGASGIAVGGAFNVNVLNREAIVNMKNSTVTAGGNAVLQATGKDTKVLAGLSAASGATGAAVSGNVIVLVESSKIKTLLAGKNNITSDNNAIIEAHYSDMLVDAAGNIAVSGSSAAVGVTSVTVVKNNEVVTDLGESTVTAVAAGKAAKNKSGEAVEGIYVGANAKETQYVGGAGVAASTGSAINGVVTVLVNNNQVIADAAKANLICVGQVPAMKDEIEIQFMVWQSFWSYYTRYLTVTGDEFQSYAQQYREGKISDFYYKLNGEWKYVAKDQTDFSDLMTPAKGDVTVRATDDTMQLLLAGGVSASAGLGAGAAVVTLVSNKDVEAKAHNMTAGKNITVSADNKDDIKQLALSVGVSGGTGVQIGAAVQVLKSKAIAQVGSEVKSTDGDFTLTADNNTTLYNIGAALVGAGGVAVAPVAAVTYFQGETEAQLNTGASVEAKNINIKATANKDINLYTVGATASGGVGVSGAANVLVSKDTNKAKALEGATLKASNNLNVEAQSDYTLVGASGVIAGAGGVAVGVNAIVSVLKSNSIAELGSKASAKNVNVKAYGKRDLTDVGISAAVAGGVGAGVTVMVLSAGAAMSQDAADMIMYGNSSEADKNSGKKNGFDAAKFMSKAESNGVESKYYSDTLDGKTLEEDLKGNGHHETQQQIGSKDKDGNNTFDASSKYRSKDLDDKEFKDDDVKGRGEGLNLTTAKGEDISDTADVKAAKNANVYKYYDPTDAVIARITENAVVDAKKVDVEARQPVNVDLLGAAIGGGTVGVGVSAAVAILHSNVMAVSMGEINNATDGITVKAESVSGEIKTDADAQQRGDAMADLMSNKPDNRDDKKEVKDEDKPKNQDKNSVKNDLLQKVQNRSIRVFGVAVGVGYVGVAVSASVALTDNTTEAVLGGKVTNAGNINVTSTHNYGAVMAGTGSVAGGFVGVGASVSVAQADGRVKAYIERDADITSNKNVNIYTDSKVDVDALAVTVGGGFVAVNAGVGLAFNRLEQETGINAGAKVNASGDLNMLATVDSSAHSYLLGVSIGAAGVNLNAAVTDVAAKINTHVGESLASREGDPDALDMPKATVEAKNVNILNNIKQTLSEPIVLSVAVGGAAAGGNLLLAFNDTEAAAMIDNGDVTAENMRLVSDLTSAAKSSLTAAQVGGLAVGISVNYADNRAYNTAIIRNSAVKTTGETRVETNQNNQNASAEASTVAAQMGLVTVGLNAAVARNNSRNYATVIGDGGKIMDFNKLTMHARGNSNANAQVEGISYSIFDVAATTVVALNDADTRTTVLTTKLKEGEYTDDRAVQDRINLIAKNGLTFDVTSTGSTTAKVKTGGGKLVGAALSIAMAYGRTASLVDVAIHGGGEYASVSSTNTARSNTDSIIENSGFAALSAAARYGAAYTQDVFRSSIQQTGGQFKVSGDVNMLTDYETRTNANVTPSTGGLDISLGTLSVNAAIARNTAKASTEYEKSVDQSYRSEIGGNLNIKTIGSAIADAKVNTAALRISGLAAGANIAIADLSMVQDAALTMGGWLTVGGSVNVTSDVKEDPTGRGERMARATASVSGIAAGGGGYSISLAQIDVSKAIAKENMQNSAIVRGGAYGTEKQLASVDKGKYVTETFYDYDYDLVDSVTYKLTKTGKTITSNEDEDDVKIRFMAYYMLVNKYKEYGNESGKMMQAVNRYWAASRDINATLLEVRNEWLSNLREAYNIETAIAVTASTYDGQLKNLLGEYEHSDDAIELCSKLLNYSSKDIERYCYYKAAQKADELGLFEWEETPNYKKTSQTKSVWHEEWEDMEVEVPLYDSGSNQLTVKGGVSIYAHSFTRSEARTDGAASFSVFSAGSLDADSFSTDNISALLEGMRLYVTGDLSVIARSDSRADSVGYQDGGISAIEATVNNAKARVGTQQQRQYVGVIIGGDTSISVNGKINVEAVNEGGVKAAMKSGTTGSLASVKSSSQPTESWYKTLISVGKNARIYVDGDLRIVSSDTPTAESTVKSSSIGLFMNFNTMKGQNLIRQENNIDFGDNVFIDSKDGNVVVEALQKTVATAETENNGGSLFVAGGNAQASNFIDRVARVNLREAYIYSEKGTLRVSASSGEGDNIYTRAYTGAAGFASVAKATANAEVTSNAEIILGTDATLRGYQDLTVEALATSYSGQKSGSENNPGINTIGQVDAAGLVAVPNGVAKNTLNFNTYIQINDYGKDDSLWNKTYLYSDVGPITVKASNTGLTAKTDAKAIGKGGVGVSNATAWNVANLQNVVWLNKSWLGADNWNDWRSESSNHNVTVIATNGDAGRDRTHLISSSFAQLSGIAGKVAPTSRITGQQVNQIRTDNKDDVTFYVMNGKVTHQASNPDNILWWELPASYKRWEVTINLLFTKVTITLTKASVVQTLDWAVWNRCDFCGTGQAVDVKPTAQETIEQRYKDAYENALAPLDIIKRAAQALANDPNATIGARLARGLLPLTYLNTLVSRPGVVFKARYGVEESTSIDKLYLLNIQAILNHDARFTLKDLERCLIWTNTETGDDVFLLINASRLVMDAGDRVKFVSDVFTGETDDGKTYEMDIITALTRDTLSEPVIPIGENGSLDFRTGVFTIPNQAEMELFLSDISGKWLVENMASGFIRTFMADTDAISEYIFNDGAMPAGTVVETVTEDEVIDGVKVYWIGKTPDEAADPDETLLFLLVVKKKDECIAYRTTKRMLDHGEEPVPVSLYVYRDSKSDRMEEEKYNVIFFDTPAGEESVVKIITDVLPGRTLEVPRRMRVTLRAFDAEGTDFPVYAIANHYFVLADGTSGAVSLFGGFYTAASDGKIFESDYILIEDISTGEMTVIVKKQQPIWPWKDSPVSGHDENGDSYAPTDDGKWEKEEQTQV